MCFAKCFSGINKDVVTLIGGKRSAYQSLMEEELEEVRKESEGEAAGGSGIRPFLGSFEEEPITFVATGSNRLETGNRVVGWGDPGPRPPRDRRVFYEDERFLYGGRDVDGGIEFRVGGGREEERAMGRSGRAAAASRENLSALLNMGNRLPSPPESKTYCYWSNLGLVKENVIKSMFVTAEVPEGLRPTMSRVGPEELNTTDQPSTPLASPSTFLGRPLARASSSLSGSLRPEDDPPAPDKKKKNLVTKAADKFMKIMRKKH